MRLEGKLAVITAAASGMGRAGVELFLEQGARVCAVDVNAAGLDALRRDLDPSGERLSTVEADLGSPDGARGSIHDAAGKLGGIDVLWAHAGIPGPGGIEHLDVGEYQKAFALNVRSATLAAGEVIGHMRKRGKGSIIFTASVSGMVGSMWSPVYSSCKFAVVGLTKSLAQTFAPDNVRVNVVCPGLADTPMKVGFTGRGVSAEAAAAAEAKMMTMIPLGRLVKPMEVAHAALWLASDDASFVTGIELPVDGGFTCK
ncbi:SDR family NAD(P)-dependent oxidoreductase [Aquibium oceanicum]|uniref:2,5-dichloro-2,5-cyclohexadiene-1,4-diol dehydrogenase n=1 Tax=Aquibium oceanicum TaxID=1670800 RepID=A0A1L3SWI2_9HYPH|nr:SDR family NAD(P)-dependent oxidoreductase [Aquibium oceanicum]APH73758.1 2,5-dichloro-2,5-cyclohexadiene-1,4-diol dehydrogenase [Aquibium oceanicum]